MENEEKKKQSMNVASLVLGIISLITVGFAYICLPTGILAIVFGVKSTKKTGSKLGKAGMIIGIVSLSILALLYIGIILIIVVSNL